MGLDPYLEIWGGYRDSALLVVLPLGEDLDAKPTVPIRILIVPHHHVLRPFDMRRKVEEGPAGTPRTIDDGRGHAMRCDDEESYVLTGADKHNK